ncbi:hypothetical protein VBM87_00970 [Mycoplasma sp. 744]|uniref:hypothetical protein n=1 Tax=unclassified Mycoplasma TaxID=2683645 RepID=UPI00211CDDE9|nr:MULTISPECIES: hypothetical protein [unclassified Mycoplasma]MEA4115357.1 hypothetical protein [Mycoplasma sp. 744]UUM19361.1 hypothetical protein NPA14_00585 [Mycoplasma sp. 1018B]
MIKKKYSLEEKIIAWNKVFKINNENFRLRIFTVISSTLFLTFASWAIVIFSLVILIRKNDNPSVINQFPIIISFLILFIIFGFTSLIFLIGLFIQLNILKKINKNDSNEFQIKKLIKIWIFMHLKSYPYKYIEMLEDLNTTF